MKITYPILSLLALAAGSLLLHAAEPAADASSSATEELDTQPGSVNHNYQIRELTPIINRALRGGRNFERGEKIFDTIGCRMCHLFGGGSGGIGPDLSGVGGRFGVLEILESIQEPSAVISDLYGTKTLWLADGSTVTGRVTEGAESYRVVTSFIIDPTTLTATWNGGPTVDVAYDQVTWIEDSYVSPMPAGMINQYSEEQIADFMAYMISGGDPTNRMFQARAAE